MATSPEQIGDGMTLVELLVIGGGRLKKDGLISCVPCKNIGKHAT
jgi:hypothetical protein